MTKIDVQPGRMGPLEVSTSGAGICLHADDEATAEQIGVFVEALRIYVERNAEYKDNWKRMGWRGQLIRIRERSERLWDSLWDALSPSQIDSSQGRVDNEAQLDDALDLINFAAFLVRGVREGNRDGSWW